MKHKDKTKFNKGSELTKDEAMIVLTINMQRMKNEDAELFRMTYLFNLFTYTQIKSTRKSKVYKR